MEKVLGFVKLRWRYILVALIALIIGSTFGPSQEQVDALDYEKTTISNKLADTKEQVKALEGENKELAAKVKEAEPFFQQKEAEHKEKEAELKKKEEAKAKKEAEEKAKAEAEAEAQAKLEKEQSESAAATEVDTSTNSSLDSSGYDSFQSGLKYATGADWAGYTFDEKFIAVETILESMKAGGTTITEDRYWFIEALNAYYGDGKDPGDREKIVDMILLSGIAGGVLNK